MKHRSIEKTLGQISVTDRYIAGDMELRIVTGGKSPNVHVVTVRSTVDFDRTEKNDFGLPKSGAPPVTLTMDGAVEALIDQLNARADEVCRALETVKVA